ncbi:MAG: hypothetical protein M1818_002069 [Claussenomyces sp. TS43310]|nr:MAG: hypothetical protein M1818_002069 [Claussenomyces sp. TS43310]
MPVGPELPPQLQKRKRSNDAEHEVETSPPSKIHAASPDETPKPRRILGPALPPTPFDERPAEPAEPADTGDDDTSSDDDDFGPSLPPPQGSSAAREAEIRAQAVKDEAEGREKLAKPKRDDWMLAPPTDSDWTSRVDPTKLKNRKFASGKGAKAPAEKSGVSAVWTETPEQKRQRLEDEVLGRKDVSTAAQSKKPSRNDVEDEATARRIREYNEKNRSRSLYEEHKKIIPKEKEDDPSKRAFDKEKDIGLGGRIGHVQKKDMLKRAGDFGSRFERGSFL